MKSREEFLAACFLKYMSLKSSGFRESGPIGSPQISHLGEIWVCDLGQNGRAAFVMYENGNVVEVHGGIYEFWKANGGGYGELGFPVSDEADYHGPDARPGDRVSEFENGIAVWRADTWQTEVRAKSVDLNIIGRQEGGEKTTKGNQHSNDVIPWEFHERVIEIITDQLGVDKDKISSTSSLVNDLQADALDLFEIVMSFKCEFGVTIPYKERGVKSTIDSPSCSLNGRFAISLLIGDTVGEIEQYLSEHKSDSSLRPPPIEDIVDPDACAMENMERAIEAGYSESEARALFLGQW